MNRAFLGNLATKLALAYHQAAVVDVEDDVALCVWVRDQSGADLNLQAVETLRELMDKEVEKFPKVVVFVEGGVVTGCSSNIPNLKVVVIDNDDKDEINENANEIKKEEHADAIYEVY